jgi:predicted dehydrogenase
MSKVAVIGAGNWGRNLVKTFHELGVLKAVAEMSDSLRDQIAEAYPDVDVIGDYRNLLKDDNLSGVAIATPVATHYTIAKEALLAGKDVFVEKPMTMSVADAIELNDIAKNNQRILMVGHLLLYQDAIQWIKDFVDQGGIGQVFSLYQTRAKLGRVRSFENVLWSFGVHDIAVLLHLVGRNPESIHIHGQRMIQNHIEDDVYLHMSFSDNVQAHLHTSWMWPEQERRLVVVGAKGMLVYNELEQTVTLHRKGINTDLSNRDEGSVVVFQGNTQPLKKECMHFIQCIEKRVQPLSNGENGIAVIRVLEEAMKQLKEGIRDVG